MAHKKLIRFEEIKTFPNVLQFPQGMKGEWQSFFKNQQTLILELACGKGEYALGLANLHPQNNYLGIDIKGNRLWAGAKKALQQQLHNVAFLRTQIDKINDYFDKNEVSEIWITFPDPQLRFSKAKKRLTHPKFLRMYQQFLKPGGLIHLKTDSPALYDFTKIVCRLYNCKIEKDFDDLYNQPSLGDELKIQTHYEKLDIAESNRIHYLSFSLPYTIASKEMDQELKSILHESATAVS